MKGSLRPCRALGGVVALVGMCSAWSTAYAERFPGLSEGAQPAVELTELRDAVDAVAALPGEPSASSAAGRTRGGTPLFSVENDAAFEPSVAGRRLVLVAGLDGDRAAAHMALEAVRWFKESASESERAGWAVSVLPLANPDGQTPRSFPPVEGYFNDPEDPELRYLWRWIAYQVPDVVVELRIGDRLEMAATGPVGSLTAALSDPDSGDGLGAVSTMVVRAPASDGIRVMREVLAALPATLSPLREGLRARLVREPLEIARLLAGRYPGTPGMAYIPAVAWVHTLRLARMLNDGDLRAKVMQEVRPWLDGERPLVGERISFAGLAGTMVFGELARTPEPERERAAVLAAEGVALAASETAPGVPLHGAGWSDDLFLGTIAAATLGDADGLDAAVRLITRYAGLLQQPNGLFHHAPDAPVAWGRGNGFAARGLAETLAALPDSHARRPEVLEIYRRLMRGMRDHQAPDGLWRQVVDVPGSYRETSVTALTLTAMARGIRLGWLDDSFREVVERGWRGVLVHVVEDGTLVDVCISTGAGPSLEYYLDRTAVNGADDRGGALVLGAALEMHALLEN